MRCQGIVRDSCTRTFEGGRACVARALWEILVHEHLKAAECALPGHCKRDMTGTCGMDYIYKYAYIPTC